jgi:hypothetical protein
VALSERWDAIRAPTTGNVNAATADSSSPSTSARKMGVPLSSTRIMAPIPSATDPRHRSHARRAEMRVSHQGSLACDRPLIVTKWTSGQECE